MVTLRFGLSGLLFSVLFCCLSPAAAGERRPNVVVFLVDDLGLMDTSVAFLTDEAGRPQRHPLNDFYRTPALERLAARGVRFNNFCAMSVCSPSRISLLTGQNAARHGTTNWIHPDEDNGGGSGPPEWNWQGLSGRDVTLPRLLQADGYRTIHVGKGHVGPRGSQGEDLRNLGFEVSVAGGSIGQPGSYEGAKNYGEGGRHAVPDLEKHHGSGLFLTEALTVEAKEQVGEAVRAGRPFFLHLSHYAAHAPFESDPRFAPAYADSGRPAAAQAFASLVEGVDRSLGELIDYLDALGVAGDTLIFFLGDNGSDGPLGAAHEVGAAAPLRGRKGSHYEGGMRTPLVVAWAAADEGNPRQRRSPVAAGVIQPQLAAIHDLFPTILEVTGTAVPAGHVVDGQRLGGLFSGRPDPGRRQTFLMHYPHAPHRSSHFTVYRDGAWKAVYHYFPTEVSGGSFWQLFHLADDPSESTNLAVSHPAELRRLMAGMAASLASHGALSPVGVDGKSRLNPVVP